MKLSRALREATLFLRAGRFREAEALYRELLVTHPEQADALHGLGLMAQMAGQHEVAVDAFWRAIMVRPAAAAYHLDLGRSLNELGATEDAISAYRRAIELRPDYSEAHSNLGIALRQHGQFDEAIAAYRRAIECNPRSAPAYYNLGNLLLQRGLFDEAADAYSEALRIKPDDVAAHHNLAIALRSLNRLDAARAGYERALALKPDSPETHVNLGNLRREEGQFDEAIAAYKKALKINPKQHQAYDYMAATLRQQGKFDEADAAYNRALEICPDDANARFNYSLLLLTRGEYRRAWPLYEARWDSDQFVSQKKYIPQPIWDGSPLAGQRILVRAEQGLGDSLQFVRYVPQVAARGGHVIVSCPRPIAELLRGVPGISELVTMGDAIPQFDQHIPMLSFPLVFGTVLESIPAAVPYLHADPARREVWRQRLGSDRGRLKVGVAWAGNPKHREDRKRSMRLEQMLPLFATEGVDFYSLQKGRGAEEIASLPSDAGLIDHAGELVSFSDTAALVMELDLVIAVDTSVVHLAGALGRPVWTLLAMGGDWRWLLQRRDTPWYPTMRLYRQERALDWESVIAEVKQELTLMRTISPALASP